MRPKQEIFDYRLRTEHTDSHAVANGRKLNPETCGGWANRLASFLASTRKSQKSHFKSDTSSISLANNRLMDFVSHIIIMPL